MHACLQVKRNEQKSATMTLEENALLCRLASQMRLQSLNVCRKLEMNLIL